MLLFKRRRRARGIATEKNISQPFSGYHSDQLIFSCLI